jgi:hypothetical protein
VRLPWDTRSAAGAPIVTAARPHVVDVSQPTQLAAWSTVLGLSEEVVAAAVMRARGRERTSRFRVFAGAAQESAYQAYCEQAERDDQDERDNGREECQH